MANEVLIAHTGQRLHVDFAQILSYVQTRHSPIYFFPSSEQ